MYVGTGMMDLVILVVLSIIAAAITHRMGRFAIWILTNFWSQLVAVAMCFGYLYVFISIYYYLRL